MDTWEPTLGTAPLLAIAAAAVATILVLVIYFRIHAFITLITVSALTALATGIPLEGVVPTMTDGFGSTLASVALLVGLGAMLGRLVENSGGAQSLAELLVRKFGEKRAPFALGVASLLMGFPIFFDAGLIVMLPVIFAVARRLDGPILAYGIPAAGAFSVTHVFLPPHPGPVAAAEFYNADIGLILLFGLLIALPTWYISGYLWGQFLGRKFPLPVPDLLLGARSEPPKNPAGAGSVAIILLLPMLLIFGNTGANTAATAGWIDGESGVVQFLRFLGQTPIALLITAFVAIAVLGLRRGVSREAIEKSMDGALGPICSVVLITGAGDALAESMEGMGIPLILAAYLIAAALRVAQGSATVALTTAAALMAPGVAAADYSEVALALIVLATAAGSVIASHVNDSGFWLVGRLMGMDTATTLKTWTVNQTLISVIGFALVMVIYGVSAL